MTPPEPGRSDDLRPAIATASGDPTPGTGGFRNGISLATGTDDTHSTVP